MTVMMIYSSDDEFGYWLYWHYYRFFAFSMYYRSCLYVLTTRVTVCVCHTEIKGYLHTYLIYSTALVIIWERFWFLYNFVEIHGGGVVERLVRPVLQRRFIHRVERMLTCRHWSCMSFITERLLWACVCFTRGWCCWLLMQVVVCCDKIFFTCSWMMSRNAIAVDDGPQRCIVH